MSTLKEMASEYRAAISLLQERRKQLYYTNPVEARQLRNIIIDLQKQTLLLENYYESWCPCYGRVAEPFFRLTEFKKLAKIWGGRGRPDERGSKYGNENCCEALAGNGRPIDTEAASNIYDALLREQERYQDRKRIKRE